MTTELDRITGALTGLAIGDALGAPVEDNNAAILAARYPNGITEYVVDTPGAVTDDTEMALLVSRSLINCGKLDLHDIARRLVAWAPTAATALGPSTGQSIRRLTNGADPATSGSTDEPSSGVLPRCAPLGLILPSSELSTATTACAQITHRHPWAVAASVLQNQIVSHLIDGTSWEHATHDVLTTPAGDPATEQVRHAVHTGHGPAGAVAVLAEAVAIVDRQPNFRTALSAAVEAGGDTDTRGATVGLLAGARWGLRTIPRSCTEPCTAAHEATHQAARLADMRARLTS